MAQQLQSEEGTDETEVTQPGRLNLGHKNLLFDRGPYDEESAPPPSYGLGSCPSVGSDQPRLFCC
jgi:hypothetical protein